MDRSFASTPLSTSSTPTVASSLFELIPDGSDGNFTTGVAMSGQFIRTSTGPSVVETPPMNHEGFSNVHWFGETEQTKGKTEWKGGRKERKRERKKEREKGNE